jgi:hypothetical protein
MFAIFTKRVSTMFATALARVCVKSSVRESSRVFGVSRAAHHVAVPDRIEDCKRDEMMPTAVTHNEYFNSSSSSTMAA